MKKRKGKVSITINGMDPQQWQEEKEGRVAVIFVATLQTTTKMVMS